MSCVFEKYYVITDPKSPAVEFQLSCTTHNCVVGMNAEPPASGKCQIQEQEETKAKLAKQEAQEAQD